MNYSEFVKVALNGCAKHWTTNVEEILARKRILDLGQLWDDFIQKEIWDIH